jgi:hypothetical protein
MRVLLEWNRLGGVADVDLEPRVAGGDRETLVTELPDHVEGLARWLLEREPQLVRGDLPLHLRAYVRGRPEEAIRRH